jgi:hypothetical protein
MAIIFRGVNNCPASRKERKREIIGHYRENSNEEKERGEYIKNN